MRTPAISVLMPVHNGRTHVGEAINSILRQTLANFEIVVIDDGSTDGSYDLLRDCKALDDRLQVYRTPHRGLVASLNFGLGLCKAENVARLDCDDIAYPERLDTQLQYLELNPEVALVGGATRCIDELGKALFDMKWPARSDGLYHFLLADCCIAHTTVMFRSRAVRKLGGYRSEYRHAEDYDLFLRLADTSAVENIPNQLCQYRLHEHQVSATNMEQQLISAIGVRLSTRARRAGTKEPRWLEGIVTRQQLASLGITATRIDGLIAEYKSAQEHLSLGWRWSNTPFFRTVEHQDDL